jgi:hypothetical protein
MTTKTEQREKTMDEDRAKLAKAIKAQGRQPTRREAYYLAGCIAENTAEAEADLTVAMGDAFLSKVKAYAREKKCTMGDAMRAIVQKHPGLHSAYVETAQPKRR